MCSVVCVDSSAVGGRSWPSPAPEPKPGAHHSVTALETLEPEGYGTAKAVEVGYKLARVTGGRRREDKKWPTGLVIGKQPNSHVVPR